VPYDDALRADILALMRTPFAPPSRGNAGEGLLEKVEQSITDVHIQAVNALINKSNVSRETFSLIGFHGQTIRHAPHEGITLQIGDAARMARELGIPVVADFRTNDVKHGGQGAPLVPLYHAALAQKLAKPVMVVNIGGVSNATWIGEEVASSQSSVASKNTGHHLIGFDIGPGNALIDDWVHRHTGARYDKDGEIAARGIADNAAVSAFLRDPYFLKDAPKSLDRNHFDGWIEKLLGVIPGSARDLHRFAEQHVAGDPGIAMANRDDGLASARLSLEDGAATLASMTATAIALSFGCVPANPRQVLICGGGRKNAHLMALLKACVNASVDAVEEVGWDGDMLEAQAFAYLAARSVQGLPLSLPTTTGVKEPMTGGVLFETKD
jgi:anhydro-N-acetylmuramic acid kinase